MLRYRNLGGISGINQYEIGDNFIKIEFTNGDIYIYDYSKPERSHVEQIKILAKKGNGLNSAIL